MRRILTGMGIGLIIRGTVGAVLGATAVWAQQPVTNGPQHGSLVLVGGANRPSFIQKFVQLAGGEKAAIVVVPTTLEDDRLSPAGLEQLRVRHQEIFGVADVTLIHTRDRKQADPEEFVKPLQRATSVWILGGNEQYLLDAYAGTRTETEIKALVARGGVLGGTSAGAIVQASVMLGGYIIPDPQHPGGQTERVTRNRSGFGLLTNCAVFAHWSQRKLQDLIAQAMRNQPDVLGIAIDEATAAIVRGNRLEVVGDGKVGIYDGKDHQGKAYLLLSPGQQFDLGRRSPVPTN